MRHSSILVLACALAISHPNLSDAEADGPDFFAVADLTQGDAVMLRADPSEASAETGRIPADGNGIRNLGCQGGMSFAEWEKASTEDRENAKQDRWCKVRYNGVTGWVAGRYLIEGAAGAASDPGFDCAKADGTVEIEVCADPALGRLDRELSRLYELALNDPYLSPARLAELKAFQRGWIKGRNECWKAGDDLADCITVNYVQRIAGIRTGYSNARSRDEAGQSTGPFAYACDGMDALISATIVTTDPAFLSLSWLDNAVILVQVPAGSGVRFRGLGSDTGVGLWMKGDEAQFLQDGQPDMTCMKEEIG